MKEKATVRKKEEEKDIRVEILWIKIHIGNLFLFLNAFKWSQYTLKWCIL